MCGIIGFSGTFEPTALKTGLRALRHRGPDDSGLHVDKIAGVGLGHTRLSILDLSPLGHQPMLSADGKVAIVFNGEIYNFHELRQELKAKGHVFRGHSDTEVLLNLYLDQGAAMLTRLNGIFAFALWDELKNSLLVARDALGVKPLYFARCSQGFSFASEIKALLPLLPQQHELDIPSLHRYLSLLWCPGDGTPIKAVRKLQPGEAMIVCQGEVKQHWNWYQLPGLRTKKRDVEKDDYISGTASHLRHAVHRQMVADVPVGAFLSGGLDSSSVVAFARELNPEINCFTIEMAGGQDVSNADDLPYAHRVAKHLGVSLDVVTIDAGKMASDLVQMVEQLDEPLADPAALNVLYISQLARQRGVKVLLSGAGGDDLFTGYRRHQALHYEQWWHWLPTGIRTSLDRQSSKLDQRFTWARRLSKLFNGAGLDGDTRIANYFMWGREADLLSLYSPEARNQLNNERAAQPLIDLLAAAPEELTPI